MSDIPLLVTSTQYLYMQEVKPDFRLPKHYIWQSSLLLPQDIRDFEELVQRIKQAGMLWLKNGDLRPYSVLIITHKTAWISYIFQRSQEPNQHPIVFGPIPRRIIRNGTPLPPYPLVFQEFMDAIAPERLKLLIIPNLEVS